MPPSTATSSLAATAPSVKQAAKKLPAPNSNFYQSAETLSANELAILKRVRAFMDTKGRRFFTGR